jgi:NAD(P)-dependent dehydrogenase (short-subunit alcohol dehydrogenase family)
MKTALITGANRGIGLEFSRQYAAEGWRVLACARHPESSADLARFANQHPGLVEVMRLDVSDLGQIEQLAKTLQDASIDLLINNAGVYSENDAKGFGHVDYDEWMRVFRINTMAPLRMAEAFFSQVSGSSLKTIVNISSVMGSVSDNSSGGNYLYRSSKAALNMVVKSLSIDLKPAGIIPVVFHPGWVRTDMGGPDAAITVEQSVSGMRRVINDLKLSDSGKFLDYTGREIPW